MHLAPILETGGDQFFADRVPGTEFSETDQLRLGTIELAGGGENDRGGLADFGIVGACLAARRMAL